MIAEPFPSVWHTLGDDKSALDYSTIDYINKVITSHLTQYKGIYKQGHRHRYRHRGRCRRIGILASCISARYRTGSLILLQDWFRLRHFFSFRYRTDWMPDSPTVLHLKKGHAPCTSILVVAPSTSILLAVERHNTFHTARPYCWLAVERDTT